MPRKGDSHRRQPPWSHGAALPHPTTRRPPSSQTPAVHSPRSPSYLAPPPLSPYFTLTCSCSAPLPACLGSAGAGRPASDGERRAAEPDGYGSARPETPQPASRIDLTAAARAPAKNTPSSRRHVRTPTVAHGTGTTPPPGGKDGRGGCPSQEAGRGGGGGSRAAVGPRNCPALCPPAARVRRWSMRGMA